MILTYAEDDRFANFSADGIAKCILKKGLAEQFISSFGEERLFVVLMIEAAVLVNTIFIFEIDDEALF